MFLTRRGILFFFLAGVLTLLFTSILSPFLGCALFDGFWLFFVAWDYFLTPGASHFAVSRSVSDKLSNGRDNRITITVDNRSPFELDVQLRDDNPFEQVHGTMKLRLKPRESASVDYTVKPCKKGDYTFGYVWMRVTGVLGLVVRQFRFDLRKTVKVYPDIAQVSNYNRFVLKGRLLELGLRPSRVYGSGMEFESLREYNPSDDYRKINWKASARRGRIIVENFTIERSQHLIIAIDAGRLMMSEVDNMSKLDYALNAAVLLSYVALKGDDRVGIVTFTGGIKDYVPPGKGKKQLYMILDALQKTETSMEEPDYGSLVRLMSLKNRKRSLVVLFTDLSDSEISRNMISYLRSLAPGHLPLCVLVNDPQIGAAAEAGVESSRVLYEKAVASELLWQRYSAVQELQRSGVMVLDVAPSRLSGAVVNKYLEVKLKGRL